MEVQLLLYVDLPNMDVGGLVHDRETAADESCFVESVIFRACPRDGQDWFLVPFGAWLSVVMHKRNTILEAKDGAYGK